METKHFLVLFFLGADGHVITPFYTFSPPSNYPLVPARLPPFGGGRHHGPTCRGRERAEAEGQSQGTVVSLRPSKHPDIVMGLWDWHLSARVWWVQFQGSISRKCLGCQYVWLPDLSTFGSNPDYSFFVWQTWADDLPGIRNLDESCLGLGPMFNGTWRLQALILKAILLASFHYPSRHHVM